MYLETVCTTRLNHMPTIGKLSQNLPVEPI